jgi:hypothetical protein
MLVFKKVRDESNQFDSSAISFESHALTTSEILEDFKCFLMACGYPIDFGDELTIIKEEEVEDEK